MSGKRNCPLLTIVATLGSRRGTTIFCMEGDCAWYADSRCAVVPPPMETLTVEQSHTTSVYVSVDGPNQDAVVAALVAALGGQDGE